MPKQSICLFKKEIINTGGDRVALLLAKELSAYYNVHLVTINEATSSIFQFDPCYKTYHLCNGAPRMRYAAIQGTRNFRKYIKKHNIKLIMNIGMSSVMFSVLSAAFQDVHIISCEHTNLVNPHVTKAHRIQQKLAAKHSDYIVTLTEKDILNYKNTFQCKAKLQYIYNPIDPNLVKLKCTYDSSSQKLVTVGRLTAMKGYDLLLKVAAKILPQHPQWQWHIYGKGEQENWLREQINTLNLSNQIRLMGIRNDIYQVYPQYGLYISTSYNEGLPMTILEAKCAKLPVVSFDCMTGPSEMILDGINGYLIKDFDVDAMCERITYLMDHPEVRQQFSDHAKDDMEKFDRHRIIAQWVKLIDSLLENNE